MLKLSRTLALVLTPCLSLLPAEVLAQTEGSEVTISIAGSSFTPQVSSTLFAVNQDGCIRLIGAAPRLFTHTLAIPHGATLDTVVLEYFDALADGDVTARLVHYRPQGSFVFRATASSSGAGGFGSSTSNPSGYIVDSSMDSFEITLDFDNASSILLACAIRVNYTLAPAL